MGAPLLWLLAPMLLCFRGTSATGSTVLTAIDVSGRRTLLTCKLNQASAQIEGHRWLKGGKVLKEDRSDSTVTEYEILTDDRSGEYQCIFLPELTGKADVQVKGPPKITVSKKTEDGNEGDSIFLTCKSHSFPPVLEWSWYRQHELDNITSIVNGSEGKYFITDSPGKTELMIQSADIEKDPGKYVCKGSNSEGTGSARITVKVRSRLAALWPFLGIVAEVLILLIIIFVSERRRKPDDWLEDDDEAFDLRSNVSSVKGRQNVRQRNGN